MNWNESKLRERERETRRRTNKRTPLTAYIMQTSANRSWTYQFIRITNVQSCQNPIYITRTFYSIFHMFLESLKCYTIITTQRIDLELLQNLRRRCLQTDLQRDSNTFQMKLRWAKMWSMSHPIRKVHTTSISVYSSIFVLVNAPPLEIFLEIKLDQTETRRNGNQSN